MKKVKTIIKKGTDSQLSTTEPKKQKQTKQTTATEQIQRNRDHMKGQQCGGEKGQNRSKIQGIRSIIGRYKIDRGKLRIVQEIVEAKELMCMTQKCLQDLASSHYLHCYYSGSSHHHPLPQLLPQLLNQFPCSQPCPSLVNMAGRVIAYYLTQSKS